MYKVINIDTEVGYNTIQASIDAALSGEIIIVSPGTYSENLLFGGKDITVQSSDYSDPTIVSATIIDGRVSGSVVRLVWGNTSTIEEFTIQNGNTDKGGGIYVD